MGLFSWMRRELLHRAEHDPDKDPFTILVNTDKNGVGGPVTGAVGNYNIRIATADDRHFEILSVNGHKGGNVMLKEGKNPLTLRVRTPSFGYLVEPNGPLNTEECRKGRGANGNEPETKCIVHIIMPRKSPFARYKDWWEPFWSDRPNAYSDYEVYLAKEDEEEKVIKVFARPEPGGTLNRLRILDRHSDNDELKRLTGVRYRTWVGWVRNRGYVLRAVFTNEELAHVESGRYKIMAHVQHGKGNNMVDQGPALEIGFLEFTQGIEQTIELTLEHINPKSPEGKAVAIGAEAGRYALFRAVAKYREGDKNWKPHNLDCIVTSPYPLINTATGAPFLAGPGLNQYTVIMRGGASSIIRMNANTNPEVVTIDAQMANSNVAQLDIDFHELKLVHVANKVPETADAEGRLAYIEVFVKVVDPTNDDAAIHATPADVLTFTIDGSDAEVQALAVGGALIPPGYSNTATAPLDGAAVARVRVRPRLNTVGETKLHVGFGRRAKGIDIDVKFTPITLELIPQRNADSEKGENPKEGGDYLLCADGYGTFGVQVRATGEGPNAGKGVKVTVTLSGVVLGTSDTTEKKMAQLCDNAVGATLYGRRRQYSTGNDGTFLFYVRAGTTDEDLTIAVTTPGGAESKMVLRLKHPEVEIFALDAEEGGIGAEASALVHADGAPPTGITLDGCTRLTDGRAYFAFRRGGEYLITVQAKWPGASTNLVRDGTVVMVIAHGETDIGEFSPHGEYAFVNKTEKTKNNQVHLKTKRGIAKVHFKVKEDTKAAFFILGAHLTYTSNKDAIPIPIVGNGKGDSGKSERGPREKKALDKAVVVPSSRPAQEPKERLNHACEWPFGKERGLFTTYSASDDHLEFKQDMTFTLVFSPAAFAAPGAQIECLVLYFGNIPAPAEMTCRPVEPHPMNPQAILNPIITYQRKGDSRNFGMMGSRMGLRATIPLESGPNQTISFRFTAGRAEDVAPGARPGEQGHYRIYCLIKRPRADGNAHELEPADYAALIAEEPIDHLRSFLYDYNIIPFTIVPQAAATPEVKKAAKKGYDRLKKAADALRKDVKAEGKQSIAWETKKEHEDVMEILSALRDTKRANDAAYNAWFDTLTGDMKIGLFTLIALSDLYLRKARIKDVEAQRQALKEIILEVVPAKYRPNLSQATMMLDSLSRSDDSFSASVERSLKFIEQFEQFEEKIIEV